MFPIFSRQFVEAREEFRQSVNFTIKVVAILGIGVAAGSILLAPQIIHFVFGREYENSVSVLRIIGIGIPLVFLRDILSYGLTAAERIRTLIWVNVATLVLNVVLNVILIPLYAHVGAALSSVASLSFSLALNYHYLEGQIKGIEMMRNWVKPLVAAGIMAIFLLFFDKLNGGVNLFILIVLGGGVYLGCTFLMQTLNSREISYLKKAFTMKWSSKHLGGPSA
jgi:O-antigen/teichoic acid export membrane protein